MLSIKMFILLFQLITAGTKPSDKSINFMETLGLHFWIANMLLIVICDSVKSINDIVPN